MGGDSSWWEVAVEKRVKNWGTGREGAGYSSLGVGVSALLAKVPPSLESITLKLHPGLKLPESMWGSESLLVFAGSGFSWSELLSIF